MRWGELVERTTGGPGGDDRYNLVDPSAYLVISCLCVSLGQYVSLFISSTLRDSSEIYHSGAFSLMRDYTFDFTGHNCVHPSSRRRS